jgi:hypothetical protein
MTTRVSSSYFLHGENRRRRDSDKKSWEDETTVDILIKYFSRIIRENFSILTEIQKQKLKNLSLRIFLKG